MKRSKLGGWLLVLAAIGMVGLAQAAPTAQQARKAKAAETALKRATNLIKTKKYKEAGAAVKQAQAAYEEFLGQGAEGAELAQSLHPQLAELHTELELQGVKLAPLPEPEGMAPAGGSTASSAPGEVSFSKQVAPMLVAKCGGCHIRGDKGGLSLKTYNDLMKGSKDGTVISKNNGPDSRIVVLIANKDMPKGGGSVSADELALLSKWIDQGAKFDGPSKDASISDLPAAGGAGSMAKPDATASAGASKPPGLFAMEIGPVLVAQCYGCHGEGQNPSAQYDMDYFAGVMKGGARGAAIIPGNAAGSLMIKQLRGTDPDGEQMPRNKPPLSEELIAKFEKWINEGAKTDGVDIARRMKEAVAVAHAEMATPEQLTKERAELAEHNWKLILPDAAPEHEESPNFLVYGNVGKDQLKEVVKIAEAQGAKVQKLLKLPSSGQFVKGRTTLYVFDKKYEYGEVGRMLEGRELPSGSRSHWNYTIIDAYACLVPAKNNEYSLADMIGKEVAAVIVASQGQVPHWFAEGSARNLAVKLNSKDPRYRQWQDDGVAVVSDKDFKPELVLTSTGPDSDAAAYIFVKSLMADAGRYQKLLAGLRGRMLFDAAFKAAYDKTPAELLSSPPTTGRR